MKITNKSQYILIYDNGLSYEDHAITPLVICSSKIKAQKFVKECNDWIAKANEEKPLFEQGADNETNEQYDKRYAEYRKYFDDLSPVFPELKENLEYNQGGRVYFIKLPMAI